MRDFLAIYKLKKADLVALLLEQSTEEMPTPPTRSSMTGPHDSAKMTLKGDGRVRLKRKIKKKKTSI